jgi:cytochrome c6
MKTRLQKYRHHRIMPTTLLAALGVALVCVTTYAQTPEKAQPGEATFKTNCALCHGDNGAGTPVGQALHVKDLNGKEVQDKSTEDLAKIVTAGKDNMPPFGKRLSNDQINEVVEYIRHLPQTK